jgi:hypothetical protein
MGAYDFMWNAIQAGDIHTLEEKVEILEKNLVVTRQWIQYLNAELEKLKNEQSSKTRTL